MTTDTNDIQHILNHSKFKPKSLKYDAKVDTVYVSSDTIAFIDGYLSVGGK